MSADFYTEILLKGTNEELLAMVMILKKYVTEKHEQYNNEHNCAYLESVRINGMNSLSMITDDQIKKIVEKSNGTINVDAMGPYGVFGLLDEVSLFQDMADAAPNTFFDGIMSGFNAGGRQSAKGTLEGGLLHLYMDYPKEDFDDEDEEKQEGYIEFVKKLLPYSKFVKLFKIDKEKFESEEYEDFIYDQMIENQFPDVDYQEFMDAVDECSEIDEDAFYDITEKLMESELVTYEEWEDDGEWDEESIYNPVIKKWK